jgi:hypothetical protein
MSVFLLDTVAVNPFLRGVKPRHLIIYIASILYNHTVSTLNLKKILT